MFPASAPGPKLHGFRAHAAEQLRLSESVVEAVHVLDNMLQRRNACIRDMELNLKCRAVYLWQLSNPTFVSIREMSDNASEQKRRRLTKKMRDQRSAKQQ